MTTPSLEEARAELEADLQLAGFRVTERVDANISPPVVVISPGNPYLTPPDPDPTFGDTATDVLVVALELFVVFKLADGSAMTSVAGRAVQDVILGIDDRWSFRDASAPFRATNLGGLPVCRVRISTNVRITSTEGTTP